MGVALPGYSSSNAGVTPEDTRALRLVSELPDLRAGYADRIPLRPKGSRSRFESDGSSSKRNQKRTPRKVSFAFGAATRIRTGDLILTKDVLYQLSHSSISQNISRDALYYSKLKSVCQYVL